MVKIPWYNAAGTAIGLNHHHNYPVRYSDQPQRHCPRCCRGKPLDYLPTFHGILQVSSKTNPMATLYCNCCEAVPFIEQVSFWNVSVSVTSRYWCRKDGIYGKVSVDSSITFVLLLQQSATTPFFLYNYFSTVDTKPLALVTLQRTPSNSAHQEDAHITLSLLRRPQKWERTTLHGMLATPQRIHRFPLVTVRVETA